jgi:hypothetical protein
VVRSEGGGVISVKPRQHPLSRSMVERRRALSDINCKWCAQCQRIRHKDDFHKCAAKADGLQAKCVECGRKQQIEYQRKNRSQITATHGSWVKRNAKAQRAYGLAYRERPEVRRRHAGRAAAYRNTIAGSLKNRTATRIYAVLKGGKGGARTEALVGWTMAELKVHLERQFLRGMNWENMGEWHIDHIVPLADFTITSSDDPELKRAWALTNLRPLWAKDNLAKHDKREVLL